MKHNGEIIIIEDDRDDREFLQEILESLRVSNKIVFFEDPTEVLSYITQQSVVPFMVLSDINMPKLNGFELRSLIMEQKDLYDKCIPYIFLSTSDNPENIHKAYRSYAHGYFKKESNFKNYQSLMRNIIEYWKSSTIPSVR
ncbi:MAG: response regulator [Chryseobacterium sp.]|nr:MAG: response regulator [Chryseobacterium sp.]